VRQLCSKFDDVYWQEHDESKEFPWEFYNAVAEAGWMGLTIPEEYGGGGLGVQEVCVVEQEIAASGAGMNGCSAVHIGMFGFESMTRYGSEAMKQKYLPRVVTGELHVSFAVTEPDAGTDTTNLSTFAKKVDGGYLISGKKVWITKAQEAERMFILARTTPRDQVAKKTDGLTMFFAPMDRDHIEIRPIKKMGRNAIDTNELFIDELFVSEDDIIGEVDKGFRAIMVGLNAERVIAANAALGIGKAAIQLATDYANNRVVFGRPIGQNQAISHQIALAQVRIDAAEAICQKTAWMVDNDLPCGKEANESKYLASEAGFNAADMAINVLGGYGYAKEYNAERYFRESRLNRIAPISQEMVLNYIAEHSLGLPRSY
jgi:acyl-CoA dehydrogenase